MASIEEEVLYSLLDDVDAMDVLAREGLNLDCIPTEEMRQVVAWAIDAYFASARTKAPSKEMIRSRWADVLEANEIDLGDGTETDDIELAIDGLKARYAVFQSQQFLKTFGTEMHTASPVEKLEVLAKGAWELTNLSLSLANKVEQTDLPTGIGDALADYEVRAAAGNSVSGLSFGIPEIDEFMGGVHAGEICTFAAPPKFGKSYFAAWVAIKQARAGRVTTLFTLENSVKMTWGRIACLELGINPNDWQKARCTPEQVDRVREYLEVRVPQIDGALNVIKVGPDQSTPTALVRKAQMLGTESLIIDQLSHVQHPEPGRKGRPEIVRDIMQELHDLVGGSRGAMSLLLLHQINRAGVEMARKQGYLAMDMLAESSEVERSSDFVLGGYQSQANREINEALFQIMASRRTDYQAWQMNWDILIPTISTIRTVNPFES